MSHVQNTAKGCLSGNALRFTVIILGLKSNLILVVKSLFKCVVRYVHGALWTAACVFGYFCKLIISRNFKSVRRLEGKEPLIVATAS
jgi:hypothetical protein